MQESTLLYQQRLLTPNPFGRLAICCLWLPQERVSEKVDLTHVAIVGNLFSTHGINYMIRNLLKTCSVRRIIVVGPDLTNSGEALLDLVLGEGRPDYIDSEIADEDIALIRDNIAVTLYPHPRLPTRDVIQGIAWPEYEGPDQWAEPRDIPVPEISTNKLPTHSAVEEVRGETFYETWAKLLHRIMTFGRLTETDYGDDQREIVGLVAVVESERTADADFEKLRTTRAMFEEYCEQLGANVPPDVSYTYGSRLRKDGGVDQISDLIETLKASKASRRAVACTWIPAKDTTSPNPPCLIMIQCFIRDGAMTMTTYIRSNDMFRAWPLNALALRDLQQSIASRAMCGLGPLVIISGSAHIYEPCWEDAIKVVEKGYRPGLFGPDPRGSFRIFTVRENSSTKYDTVRIQHYAPSGELLQTFDGKTIADLRKSLAGLIGRMEHALYLGAEIANAVRALETNSYYENR